MQKINVISIIAAHIRTLRTDGTNSASKSDVLVMYIFPLAIGLAAYLVGWRLQPSSVALAITVYSIFAALLLSVQVALYGVSLRPMKPPSDTKKLKQFESARKLRAELLSELNDNISYLILLSVVFVTVLLLIAINDSVGYFETSMSLSMYTHFFLTLIMVIKRSSIVFSREYDADE